MLELNSARRGQKVDSKRRVAELDDDVGFEEICRFEADRFHPEVVESGNESACIARLHENPDI